MIPRRSSIYSRVYASHGVPLSGAAADSYEAPRPKCDECNGGQARIRYPCTGCGRGRGCYAERRTWVTPYERFLQRMGSEVAA
jgi:hypothetical protein